MEYHSPLDITCDVVDQDGFRCGKVSAYTCDGCDLDVCLDCCTFVYGNIHGCGHCGQYFKLMDYYDVDAPAETTMDNLCDEIVLQNHIAAMPGGVEQVQALARLYAAVKADDAGESGDADDEDTDNTSDKVSVDELSYSKE